MVQTPGPVWLSDHVVNYDGCAKDGQSGLSGAGTVRMTDGDEATFMFGPAAASF
ncbi:MAG: hypothetical protein AB7O13_06920 [Alphaproteobacteria bacterium]